MTTTEAEDEPTAARVVTVATAPAYAVTIGAGLLERLPATCAELAPSRLAVLTDANVAGLYGARLATLGWDAAGLAPEGAPIEVVAGEDAKRFGVLERVLDELVARDLDRRSALIAFGGGVVGDLGGLAASLFMRGIPFVQCPTTLLAMVDSSVGGKTAVNLAGGKNLAGTFHQPRAVVADTSLLATLDDEELASGLGEVVKTALIGDADLLGRLVDLAPALAARDPEALGEVVERCVRVKAAVVAADEREQGRRKELNLGHTFAHGIEWDAGYGTIPHGVAVAAGLALACRAAERIGRLEDDALPARVEELLKSLGLPAGLDELRRRYGVALPGERLLEGLRHDKKGTAGIPAFVLPTAAGRIRVDQPLDHDLLQDLLA